MPRPSSPAAAVRGRFAPSPSGELHLGNASTALLAWLSVRSRGGTFVMRVEDLDQARSRAELIDHNLDDLRWLGLEWDEGPDLGGPHAPYVQGERTSLYHDAYRRLRDLDRLYTCFCSRKEIAAAANAPQEPGEQRRYPGTCREIDPAARARRIETGSRYAWRMRLGAGTRPRFRDQVHGERGVSAGDAPDDFVVWRSDGVPAYQLAVVVDDAAMEITEVVRGDDLLASTTRQLVLYEALGLTPPTFAHVPLLLGPDGQRLSKRHAGVTLRELRGRGIPSQRVVGALAWLLRLRLRPELITPAALARGFDLRRLDVPPHGVEVDVDRLFPDREAP